MISFLQIFFFSSTLFSISFSTAQGMQEAIVSMSVEKDISSEFVRTLGSTLEEGFFGGVKWGIAAALYHVFYRIMAIGVVSVPYAVNTLKSWYAYWADTRAGRPPVLNIHELQVLVTLLQESLAEYEALGIPTLDHKECALLCNRTLSAVMEHIHQYVTMRAVRYTDQYTDQEVIFLISLIAETIRGILECVGCAEFHREVVATAKTTIVLMSKLITLLQGPVLEKDPYDPSIAWFSNKRGFYVWYP